MNVKTPSASLLVGGLDETCAFAFESAKRKLNLTTVMVGSPEDIGGQLVRQSADLVVWGLFSDANLDPAWNVIKAIGDQPIPCMILCGETLSDSIKAQLLETGIAEVIAPLGGEAELRARIRKQLQSTVQRRTVLQHDRQLRLLRIAGRSARIGGWSIELPEWKLIWSDEIRDIHEVPSGYEPTLEEAITYYPEEYQEKVARYVNDCAIEGIPYDFELELITAKQRRIWIRAIGEAIRSEGGSIVGLQGAFQDITDRKATAEALDAHERRFRQLAESMPIVVWSAEPDGSVNYVNHHFYEFSGVSPRESAELRWREVLHPADLKRSTEAWQQCVREEMPFEIDYRIKGKSIGEYHWFHVQAVPARDESGNVYQWYGSAIDVDRLIRAEAEVKESARKLKITLESITDACFTVDEEWRFTYVNAEMERLVLRKRNELLGKSIWDAFPDANGSPSEYHYRRAVEERITEEFETYYDPLKKWFEVRAYPSEQGLSVYFHDITQKKKDEEHLLLLENSIARSNDIVVITKADPIDEPGPEIVYVNDAFERITGYKREAVMGRSPRLLQGPETNQDALDRIREALKNKEPIEEEILNYSVTGEAYWIQLNLAPVANDLGVVTHFIGVQRNITDWKREESFKEWETRVMKLLSSGAPAQNIYREIVSAVETMIQDVVATIMESDSERKVLKPAVIEGLSNPIRNLFKSMEIREGNGTCGTAAYRKGAVVTEDVLEDPSWSNYRELAKEEGIRSCWSTPVINNRGEVLATFAIYREKPYRPETFERRLCERLGDLIRLSLERDAKECELRTSEERFRLLSKATNDAIWDWNLTDDTVWWNEGYEVLFGFKRDEVEQTSESWTKWIHPEDKDRIVGSIERAIQSGEQYWSGEYRFQKKDGSYAIVMNRGFVLHDEAGKPVRMIGGMTDLTERKKLEQQFLRAQRIESIGTLAGGIAHDLNNLLTPIIMGVSLLKKHASGTRQIQVLEGIEHNADRGAELVKQILSFARGVEGVRVSQSVEHIVGEVEAIVKNIFPKNIRFEKVIEKGIAHIQGDPTQLNQVMLNLCVNARDAMPGGGKITIFAENVHLDDSFCSYYSDVAPGAYVLVEVRDDGMGMSKEVVDRIFEPFFTTKKVGKGTGLGLSTVLTIVRSHGGITTVKSEAGKGTSFRVYFPAQSNEPKAINEEDQRQSTPEGKGQLILVVDDESSILHVMRRTLEAYGYKVLTAEDGAQATRIYAKHQGKVALVITDMMMPVMDGSALIASLRTLNPAVRIIAISGLQDHDKDSRPIKVDVDYTLSKPYSTKEMLCIIDEVLNKAP